MPSAPSTAIRRAGVRHASTRLAKGSNSSTAWTGPALRIVAVAALCAGVTACSTTQEMASKTDEAEIETATKFSEAAFGVAASVSDVLSVALLS